MQHVIRHLHTGEILYTGESAIFAQTVEAAVRDGVDLGGGDFRYANLINADLDDGLFRGACFADANLMGANMADIMADGADFFGAALQNCCLCAASLRGCVFSGTAFGATDIEGSILSDSRFSTLSSLLLNFASAETLSGCRFTTTNAGDCFFSSPPVAVLGLSQQVALLDRDILIGTQGFPLGRQPREPREAEATLFDVLTDWRLGRMGRPGILSV